MSKRDRTPRTSEPKPGPGPVPAVAGGLLPRLAELFDPKGPFLLPLALLLVARLIAFATLPIASEDAYITFRYARHFAFGQGLVFNPGEHAMGYTSPLWVMWCSLGFVAGQDPVLWTRIASLAADVMTLLLMAQLLRRHASTLAAAAFGVFFAGWPYFSAVAASGMEVNLMLALIALSAALAERRHLLSGPALAALALVRPEGIVSAALLAAGASWRDRIVALALAVAGWGAMASLHGGAWLPQSVSAKASLYGTPGPWLGRHWWEWLSPIQLGRWPSTAEGNMLAVIAVVMTPALVLGLVALWKQRGSALSRAIAGALVVWAGYAALGVAFFMWYLLVPLAGIGAAAAVGLPRLVRSRALLAMLALVVVGTWPVARTLYVGRTQNEYFAFSGAADYLRGAAQPGQSVMLEPIGIIGFQCPLVVIDEVGLVSPDVAARRLKGAGWYTDVAIERGPDWLVVRKSVRESSAAFAGAGAPFRSPAERDSLFARYRLEHVADPGRNDLEVFRRFR